MNSEIDKSIDEMNECVCEGHSVVLATRQPPGGLTQLHTITFDDFHDVPVMRGVYKCYNQIGQVRIRPRLSSVLYPTINPFTDARMTSHLSLADRVL